MADFTRVGIKEFYIGASTDDKPASAPPGSQAYEHNTGALFIMAPDMSTWTAYAPKKFIADGTVAAPGMAFASDPDTGIYRTTTNTLALTAGGTQVFAAGSDGKIVLHSQANHGIFSDARDDFITFVASPTSDQSGGMLALSGGDRENFPGWICLDIGDRRAGKTPASKLDITYSSNGANITLAYVTYQGALQLLVETANAGLFLGASQDAAVQWDVADANANCLKVGLPAGGEVNVPVAMFGIGIAGVDLTWFNGFTMPTVAVVDTDRDSYLYLSWSADDAPAIGVGGAATILQIQTTINLASSKVIQINSTQVVGARVVDARCDDTIAGAGAYDDTTAGVIDALRDAMIAHGLIAAS